MLLSKCILKVIYLEISVFRFTSKDSHALFLLGKLENYDFNRKKFDLFLFYMCFDFKECLAVHYYSWNKKVSLTCTFTLASVLFSLRIAKVGGFFISLYSDKYLGIFDLRSTACDMNEVLIWCYKFQVYLVTIQGFPGPEANILVPEAIYRSI